MNGEPSAVAGGNVLPVDPVVAEVRRARESYAAQMGYDLQAIYRDLKRQEQEGGRKLVSLPPRRPRIAPKRGVASMKVDQPPKR
jgi:hypothetical protein